MRKIIILRGIPGCGKSTWVKNNNLEAYTLCPDQIRLLFSAPLVDLNGKFGINQANDKKVWELFYQLLEEKMDRGETIVVDATTLKTSSFAKYQELAKTYFYDMLCVDFSETPIETCLVQNLMRPEYKQVPEDIIRKHYEAIKQHKVPKSIKRMFPEDVNGLDDFFENILKEVNLDHYKKLHFIGDLQGCGSVTQQYFDSIGGFKDDEFYVFVGDFIDRGIENGLVMSWACRELIHRKNVLIIMGNHERHLVHWCANHEPRSNEFADNTLPQIIKASVTKSQVYSLLRKMYDFRFMNYHGQKMFVSHAGVSVIPTDIHMVTSKQLWNNFGNYASPVDKMFEENQKDYIQVHGHRNTFNLPIDASSNSKNLEGRVEFGGDLRVVTFEYTDNQLISTAIEIPNKVYKSFKDRALDSNIKSIESTDEPYFVQDYNFSNIMSDKLFHDISNHKLIKAKGFETYSGITSFSFTKKAFYDKAWDSLNVKARGLYVHNDTKIILARSYEKFFNYQENEAHQKHNLKQTLTFPVDVYVKENGFLGLISYDCKKDSLFITSKSNPESPFAELFKKIFDKSVDYPNQQVIKRLLRDQQCTLVFEVIDPINDPHMIEYPEEKLVLLDIVANSEKFKRATFEQVKAFANKFGLEHKKRFNSFNSWDKLEGWMDNLLDNQDDNLVNPTHPVEGYVVEDSANVLFKLKCNYYSFWKYMRSVKDKKIRSLEGNTEFKVKKDDLDEIGQEFVAWVELQDADTLKKDIITLRRMFNENKGMNIINILQDKKLG